MPHPELTSLLSIELEQVKALGTIAIVVIFFLLLLLFRFHTNLSANHAFGFRLSRLKFLFLRAL
jgi:hypothetical protein